MSTAALKVVPASPPSPASAQLRSVARSGLLTLSQIIPRVVWRGFVSAFKGLLVFVPVGALFGGVAAFLGWQLGGWPGWLLALDAVVASIAFGAAGGYTGAVRGALAELAAQLQQRGAVRAVYALVRPAALKVARQASQAARPLTHHELTVALTRSVGERLRQAEETVQVGGTWVDRIVRFLARRAERMLVLAASQKLLRSKDPKQTLLALENSGLESLEQTVGETLLDVHGLQVTLAWGAAVIASALPSALYVLLR